MRFQMKAPGMTRRTNSGAEQAAETEVRRAAAAHEARQAEMTRLVAEVTAEENDAQLGAPGAAERARELCVQLDAAKVAERQAAEAHTRATARLQQISTARVAEADQARLRSIPALRREYEAKMFRVERAVADAAQALNEAALLGRRLAAAIGGTEALRLFALPALAERVSHCMATTLTFTEHRPDEVAAHASGPLSFRWFSTPINPANPWCKASLIDVTRDALDSVAIVFDSPEDAVACRARRDPGGTELFTVPLGNGLWHLVPGRLRGHAAREAEAALAQAKAEAANAGKGDEKTGTTILTRGAGKQPAAKDAVYLALKPDHEQLRAAHSTIGPDDAA
jgi:hypothetical protein